MKTLMLIAVVAALALAGIASASTPTLTGTVGPGFTITLKQGSKTVKTLKAGTYKLVVRDESSIHNFSLHGPHGFSKAFTTVPFSGTKTFTVKLTAGSYTYYCAAHRSEMFGHFTVK